MPLSEKNGICRLAPSLVGIYSAAAELDVAAWEGLTRTALLEELEHFAEQAYAQREVEIGADVMRDGTYGSFTRGRYHLDGASGCYGRVMTVSASGLMVRKNSSGIPTESYRCLNRWSTRLSTMSRASCIMQVSQPQAQRVARPAAPVAPAATRASARSRSNGGTQRPLPCGSGKKYKRCCGREALKQILHTLGRGLASFAIKAFLISWLVL